VLTAYAVLLFLVPSNLVFKPLGAAGTPAGVAGLLLLIWWANARLVPGLGAARGMQPIRIMAFVFGGAVVASYAAASVRPAYGAEISGANRGILGLAGLIGVAMVAADGIPSMDRLHALVRRIVALAAVISFVGVLQFAAGFDLAKFVQVPGLTANTPRIAFFPGGFRRVAGTAGHPIEYGMVLAMSLPLALWMVLDTVEGKRGRWRFAAALIALATPMSLSRSAFFGLAFGGLVILGGLSWKRRRQAAVMLIVYAAAMQVLVPGLLGTVKSLFLNIRNDPSFQGRTQDYAHIGEFISQRPIFGRGYGTFLPEIYILLDNQYIGLLIETGVVGLASLLGLFLTGIFSARGARRRSTDASTRQLGQSFAASVVIAMTSFITFDALSFAMVTGLLFLLLGSCGALWRLTRERDVAGSASDIDRRDVQQRPAHP
jgi:O-antigen ligase